jgi:hypothetical protein
MISKSNAHAAKGIDIVSGWRLREYCNRTRAEDSL